MTDNSEAPKPTSLKNRPLRYVNLGEKNNWWPTCFERSEVHFKWNEISDEYIKAADRAEIIQIYLENGKSTRSASTHANAIIDIVNNGQYFIWITKKDSCLFWCTTKEKVFFSEVTDASAIGHFWIECDTPWSNRSVSGKKLQGPLIEHVHTPQLTITKLKIAMESKIRDLILS